MPSSRSRATRSRRPVPPRRAPGTACPSSPPGSPNPTTPPDPTTSSSRRPCPWSTAVPARAGGGRRRAGDLSPAVGSVRRPRTAGTLRWTAEQYDRPCLHAPSLRSADQPGATLLPLAKDIFPREKDLGSGGGPSGSTIATRHAVVACLVAQGVGPAQIRQNEQKGDRWRRVFRRSTALCGYSASWRPDPPTH
ncbi:exported hypothetical protein [Frankia canadensis]|uniref:Uncharacterized protein n=1 Tax=Frankia canadensis TaxID=1836972 RepID=A0A2I2KZM8_9ACTN|nr:exported hypothetical protein [Frankia canadensis]SOU58414.1 exported hypothetical protein [Frankia canadensis]